MQRSFPDVPALVRALRPSYPIFCLRPEILEGAVRRFTSMFPGRVLYAVKCNPQRRVLDVLHGAGIRHFDTASLPEIAQICESYDDSKAYFMHPVKGRAVINTAYKVYGVRYFVVDHQSELEKVLAETGSGSARSDLVIVVRLKTPNSSEILYDLSAKFGAPPDQAAELLRAAAAQGCRIGLSFHVGSQCASPKAFGTALAIVGDVIARAGAELHCLDVGGGFPTSYANTKVPPLEEYMAEIRAGLKALALNPTVEIFAEPGRTLVADCCSLLTQVQLRKGDQLYINDGIYGSLSEMVQVDIRLPARLIRLENAASRTMRAFVLNGPTCDSLDVVPGTFDLPEDTREGDWIEIDQLGAYAQALATRFNGFYPETLVEVHDAPPAAGG